MGRRPTAVLLALGLVVVAAGAAIVYAERSTDHDEAVTVTVRQLWRSAEAYEGRRVKSEGVVRVFSPGSSDEHYVLAQAGQYRVGIRGLPHERLEPLVGRLAAVQGVVHFQEDFGVYIDAEGLATPEDANNDGGVMPGR